MFKKSNYIWILQEETNLQFKLYSTISKMKMKDPINYIWITLSNKYAMILHLLVQMVNSVNKYYFFLFSIIFIDELKEDFEG